MTTNLYVTILSFNIPAVGWELQIWPASAFPNNPITGQTPPVLSSPTGTLTTSGGADDFTGLASATQYWIAVFDPIAGIVRWYPVPETRLGNSSGDPLIISVPPPSSIFTMDVVLDQTAGSLIVWDHPT